jgi:hypothetical protein
VKATATVAADKAKATATNVIDAVKAKLPKKEADFVEEIVCEEAACEEAVAEDIEDAVAAAACECEA